MHLEQIIARREPRQEEAIEPADVRVNDAEDRNGVRKRRVGDRDQMEVHADAVSDRGAVRVLDAEIIDRAGDDVRGRAGGAQDRNAVRGSAEQQRGVGAGDGGRCIGGEPDVQRPVQSEQQSVGGEIRIRRHADAVVSEAAGQNAVRLRHAIRQVQDDVGAIDDDQRSQGQAMEITAGDGDHLAQADRHAGLTGGVVSPGHHGAVVSQGETVETAGGDGHHIGQARRYRRLTRAVIAPGHHRPIV